MKKYIPLIALVFAVLCIASNSVLNLAKIPVTSSPQLTNYVVITIGTNTDSLTRLVRLDSLQTLIGGSGASVVSGGGVSMAYTWSTNVNNSPASGFIQLDPTYNFPGTPAYVASYTNRDGIYMQPIWVILNQTNVFKLASEADPRAYVILESTSVGLSTRIGVSFTTLATGPNWPPTNGDNVSVGFFTVH